MLLLYSSDIFILIDSDPKILQIKLMKDFLPLKLIILNISIMLALRPILLSDYLFFLLFVIN